MMLARDMLDFRKELDREGIMFCYSGYMTEQILSGIANALKQKLAIEDTDKKIARGMFSLFVEQVQNVIRYSVEKSVGENQGQEIELSYGLLIVGQLKNKHFVACGNKIEKKDVTRLQNNLTQIQQLDKQGLKELYKQILKGDVPEGSKGAGVGFVDIARRAEQGFEFDFLDLDEHYAYFTLKAYM